MNPVDLVKLPWTSFKNKDQNDGWLRAVGDESGWILSNLPEAAELRELLKQGETTLRIGDVDFDIRLSLGQGMFIQRNPVREREYGRPRYGY